MSTVKLRWARECNDFRRLCSAIPATKPNLAAILLDARDRRRGPLNCEGLEIYVDEGFFARSFARINIRANICSAIAA